MPDRSQKLFISAGEFIQSWDKELYELTNLDYFIFRLINEIGNRLEKKYFNLRRKMSKLFLDFEEIGTLCFNLGDSIEFFLKGNCLKDCSIGCLKDLDGQFDFGKTHVDPAIKHRLLILQAFLPGKLDKEQILRIDLMNQVIFDTLLQFYYSEFNVELKEDDLDLIELAEFIEDGMIFFIRSEGQTLLMRYAETAIDIFEELLQAETDYEKKESWYQDSDRPNFEDPQNEWSQPDISIEQVFSQITLDQKFSQNTDNSILFDLLYLERFFTEYLKLTNVNDIQETHLAEFFSVWLVKEFEMNDEKQLDFIFKATARFITHLNQYFNINFKHEFLTYYDSVKTDLPRVVKALNIFIRDYDVLNILLNSEKELQIQQLDYYEIIRTYGKASHLFDAQNLMKNTEILHQVHMQSPAFTELRKGDIIQASFLNEYHHWKVLDIQYIYPKLAKNFVMADYH